MSASWGILGPGSVESVRRVRTLGLASSTRLFNELAVPGLGGVWFGKQLLFSTLGVMVAEQAALRGKSVTQIEVANAIEALACWMALAEEPQAGEGRIRGTTKLAGLSAKDFIFRNASRPGFYVTQPMRMATVNVLPALGLVQPGGGRFNSFRCSEDGLAFVETAFAEHRPFRRSVPDHLLQWVLGQVDKIDSPVLREALSPLQPLSEKACTLLRERLLQGSSASPSGERQRRRDALNWVQSRRENAPPCQWEQQPTQISDPKHWSDMRAGAGFFAARDAAQDLLNKLEVHIGDRGNRFLIGSSLPQQLREPFSDLQFNARAFLELQHEDKEATTFCREVISADDNVLRQLVARDGRILRLVGDHVCAGQAFEAADAEASASGATYDQEDSAPADNFGWPPDISHRVRNLWWLSLDIERNLNAWLHPIEAEVAHG